MRQLIWFALGALTVCVLALPFVFETGYEQGYWERGVVACEPNEYRPKRR